MGTELTGREAVVALKKATTWGTAVECGASDGILITSESIQQTIEPLVDDSLGAVWPKYSDQGKRDASGPIDAYLRYEGLDVALALIMGTAATPSQQAATSAYVGKLELADNIVGKFATIAQLKKSDKVFENPTAKLFGFTISCEALQPAKLSLEVISNNVTLDSSTNTNTTMANVTYPDYGNRVIMNSDCEFRINDQSGDALDSGDKIYPSSFEFKFSRQMEGDLTCGSNDFSEPGETAMPQCQLTLNFPRYNDDTDAFFSDWDAHTSKKADIYLKGNLIEDTYYYDMRISMPHLKVVNPQVNVSGQGKIPMSVTFDVLGASAAPTGMSGLTNPFEISYTNTRTTSPLA